MAGLRELCTRQAQPIACTGCRRRLGKPDYARSQAAPRHVAAPSSVANGLSVLPRVEARTTFLTTTLTTVQHRGTSGYITSVLPSCLVTVSAHAYGSEGWGFESLRARSRSVSSAWADSLPGSA
ncbi:MAG: hypothetical protein QOG14_3396 [Mycobacterium sp.]|jgi:hypothetical protein|nr:hypothetical protein [Mycobacterium sp.]